MTAIAANARLAAIAVHPGQFTLRRRLLADISVPLIAGAPRRPDCWQIYWSNAVRHTPSGGLVGLSVAPRDAHVEVQVREQAWVWYW